MFIVFFREKNKVLKLKNKQRATNQLRLVYFEFPFLVLLAKRMWEKFQYMISIISFIIYIYI